MSLSGSTPNLTLPGPAANTQQNLNLLDAKASQAGSMVNQNNPYGSLTYATQKDASGKPITGPGGVPLYTANVTLSPQEQSLFNTLLGTQQEAGTSAKDLLKSAGYGSSTPSQSIGDMQKGLEGQQMAGYLQSMQPFFTTQQDQLDTKLRNQGLAPGQPGYDNAMRQLTTNNANAVAGAAANYAPQAFNQASSLYQMPAQLSAGLAALGQPGSPNQSLVQTPGLNVNAPDYLGATEAFNNAQIQQSQLQNQYQTNMLNALMSPVNAFLGGWGRSVSDRRLKKNITAIGKLENGLNVYRFAFAWENGAEHIGLMADEVEQIHPEAVSEVDGFQVVNYDLAIL